MAAAGGLSISTPLRNAQKTASPTPRRIGSRASPAKRPLNYVLRLAKGQRSRATRRTFVLWGGTSVSVPSSVRTYRTGYGPPLGGPGNSHRPGLPTARGAGYPAALPPPVTRWPSCDGSECSIGANAAARKRKRAALASSAARWIHSTPIRSGLPAGSGRGNVTWQSTSVAWPRRNRGPTRPRSRSSPFPERR